jgi:hypothetical protein
MLVGTRARMNRRCVNMVYLRLFEQNKNDILTLTKVGGCGCVWACMRALSLVGWWWVVLNDFFGLRVQTILHYKILELYAVCVRVQYLLPLASCLLSLVGWVGC